MARTYSFSSAGKAWGSTTAATGASGTLVWSPAEIDSAGVVAFHLGMSNEGTTTSDVSIISRIRVKANGQTVIDCTPTELRAYQERFSPKGNSNTSSGTTLTIPLNSLDSKGDDDGDRCQFMPGASATVEIVYSNAAVSGQTDFGNFYLAWTKTTIAPEFYMTLLTQAANVAQSAVNGRSPLSGPGFVQGLGITTANLNRVRTVLSGLEVANLPGALYNGLTTGDLMRETQELYENPDDNTMVTSFQWVKLAQGLEANPATSWLELTTGSSWAATDPIGLYTLVPVQPQRA
jgi:hypothetical protein